MTKDADLSPTRYVPAGSCTWCGHPPHAAVCDRTIKTKDDPLAPCPCARAKWAADTPRRARAGRASNDTEH